MSSRPRLRAAYVAVLAVLGCAVIGTAPASATPHLAAACTHPQQSSYFEQSDFNCDSATDYVVGVPGYDHGVGAVEVRYSFSSKRIVLLTPGQQHVPGPAQLGERFGSAITTAYLNADGFDDLAIGIPDLTVDGMKDAGGVQVMYGAKNGFAAGPLLTRATPGIPGDPVANEHFGAALHNGDGGPENRLGVLGGYGDGFYIGVPGATVIGSDDQPLPQAGAVLVLGDASQMGPTALPGTVTTLTQGSGFDGPPEAGAHLGATLGDGDWDVTAGAPDYSTATLKDVGFWGRANETGNEGSSLFGTQAGEHLGASLGEAQTGSDEYVELMAGAPGMTVAGHQNAGAVFLSDFYTGENDEYGGTTMLTQNSPRIPGSAATGNRFGASVAGATRSVSIAAIGVPGAKVDGRAGAGEVITYRFGSRTGSLVSQATTGVAGVAETGDHFGAAVAFALRLSPSWSGIHNTLEVGVPGEDLKAAPNAGVVESFPVNRDNLLVVKQALLLGRPHPSANSDYGATLFNEL